MRDGRVVCILGMHRSGTSLVTRLVNLLGVYLGPAAHLLTSSPDNPEGYWEHRGLVAVNDGILGRLGGDWHTPPRPSAGWEALPGLDELKRRARTILEQDFASADLWGWKDPRTCLTLPFWQSILGPMSYVLCLRHPGDVASSLRRRDGFSLAKGVYLWCTYLKSALEYTAGRQRCVCRYEDVMADCRSELRRLGQFLELGQRAEQPAVQASAQAFIRPDLRHHRASGQSDRREPPGGDVATALELARQAYESLGAGVGAGRAGVVCRTLEEAVQLLVPVILEERAVAARRAHSEWLARVQAAAEEVAALVPAGQTCIVVDEEQWGLGREHAGRRLLPFLERDGQYWGVPADDGTAIRELERLRQAGAGFLVVGWPAFWWLDYYGGFARHVRENFRCVLKSSHLIGFDLRQAPCPGQDEADRPRAARFGEVYARPGVPAGLSGVGDMRTHDRLSTEAEGKATCHRELVGGRWEEIGRLQFDFLRGRGLLPSHRLLDVGCGALRGGVHFIRYLQPGHYYGIDRDASLLRAGRDIELAGAGLQDREPHLLLDERFDFARFGTTFRFALAQSVFTHLPLNSIERCLVNLARVLEPGGLFYATYFEAPSPHPLEPIRHTERLVTWSDADPFHYHYSVFPFLITGLPLAVKNLGAWGHPLGQHMLEFTRV